MSASANPTLPRRSFLGWTAALLLTRPALAVPEPEQVIVDYTSESEMLPTFYSVWLRDRVTGQWRMVSGWARSGESVAF